MTVHPTHPIVRKPNVSLSSIPSVQFFRRNTGLILGVGAFVAFWMTLYAWTAYTPRYSAKSTVIIKDSAITSRYVEPQQNYALQTTTSSSSNPVLNTMALLKSANISDALWEYLSTKHPEELKNNHIKTKRQWESFFQDGSSFIKAKNQPGTDLISIQFSWRKAIIAQEGLNEVVKAFQDSSRDMNKLEEVSRTHFLGMQMKDLEANLRKIRHQKSLYRSHSGTVSMNREQDELAASRMEMTNRLSQLEAIAQGKESQVRTAQGLLHMAPAQALAASAVGQNNSMAKLQDELYRLRQFHSLLRASLTDSNPKVKEAQAQIEQVSANLEAERHRTSTGSGSSVGIVADSTRSRLVDGMLQAQNESRDLRAQATVIRARLGEINQEISKYPSLAENLSNIEQQEASLSLALDQLRQKVMEGRIKEEQTLSNVFVVDAARLPEKSQFPTPLQITIIGILLGLGTGTAAAFIRERLLSSATYPSDPKNPTPTPPSGWFDSMDDNSDIDDEIVSALPAPGGSTLSRSRRRRSSIIVPPSTLNMAPIGVEEDEELAAIRQSSVSDALNSLYDTLNASGNRTTTHSNRTLTPASEFMTLDFPTPSVAKTDAPHAGSRVQMLPPPPPAAQLRNQVLPVRPVTTEWADSMFPSMHAFSTEDDLGSSVAATTAITTDLTDIKPVATETFEVEASSVKTSPVALPANVQPIALNAARPRSAKKINKAAKLQRSANKVAATGGLLLNRALHLG
jgi:uncharacterized protein involved in exopolysaccharide biosynthesis